MQNLIEQNLEQKFEGKEKNFENMRNAKALWNGLGIGLKTYFYELKNAFLAKGDDQVLNQGLSAVDYLVDPFLVSAIATELRNKKIKIK